MKQFIRLVAASLALLLILSGCATLEVSPRLLPDPAPVKSPLKLGVQPASERVRTLLAPGDSPIMAALSHRYGKVVLLPPSSRLDTLETIRSTHDVDRLLTVGVNDFTVNGSLNPLWFASIPLLFFKPYAPIVTFDAVVMLDGVVRELPSGKVLFQKEVSERVTDHFSPRNPQDRVQELIDRGVNNAMVSLLREMDRTVR